MTDDASRGIPPRWTSSAKSGVGTALSASCRVWFTLSHGILNEVYYPRVDSACIRDLGFLVSGPEGYFSEEKRHTESRIETLEDGVPAYRLVNTARDGRYAVTKQVIVDPDRESVLQHIEFANTMPESGALRLFALVAPHLVNAGADNTAWIDDYKGATMLFASGTYGVSLALAASTGFKAASAGYVGIDDGWRQVRATGGLDPSRSRAGNGNVSLAGEIDLSAGRRVLLALGFGARPKEAAYNARASLMGGFEPARRIYAAGWRQWQKTLEPLDEPPAPPPEPNRYRISTAVLAAHRPLSFKGPAVASLSIPWGFAKGDEDLGGYHLVWPRDLVETAGGFLAAGAPDDALGILAYLRAIQEDDGHWPQNAWLDGVPYWNGIQMDECAFPILLTDALRRAGTLAADSLAGFAPMVEAAAGFVVRNGPVTGQDRWEEDGGYSPFTLAVEIAGLLAAADILETCGRGEHAGYLRETADAWNDQIERWTYVSGNAICADLGVDGYYVRISPPDVAEGGSAVASGFVPIKNRPPGESSLPTVEVVSPDALALVRFGLRAADDPRIVDTVKVVDATLKCDLPQGPLWYRYTGDGYGEHADGGAFDGVGIGRPWPLLAGERAHYEIAAGRFDEAAALLATLEKSAGDGGLLPEQVWDCDDIPERELFRGRPSGSAMPLVWAHAEHIKLLRSLRDGAVFDMPPQGVERYVAGKTVSPFQPWRFNNKVRAMPAGKLLRIEVFAPAVVHWSTDGWATTNDLKTRKNGFGFHLADLPVAAALPGTPIVFTFYWYESGHWENVDFTVTVG